MATSKGGSKGGSSKPAGTSRPATKPVGTTSRPDRFTSNSDDVTITPPKPSSGSSSKKK